MTPSPSSTSPKAPGLLEYRNVVITGASSGIGAALARWFAVRGANVWAAARRMDQLEQLAESLPKKGKGGILPVQLDVTDPHHVVDVLNQIDDECGPNGVDCVIANAGMGRSIASEDLSFGAVEKMLNTNVVGAAATLHALVPKMVARGRGHLVGVSSLASWSVMPKHGMYSASKVFVSTLCRGLYLDLQPHGLRVTSIHPGFVKSELTAKNKFQMPFILETDDAADRMGRAILAGKTRLAFPWQTYLLVRLAALMPASMLRSAGRRGGD